MHKRLKISCAVVVVASHLSAGFALATAYVWNGGEGTWTNPANWTPNGFPSASADTADVGGGLPHIISNVGAFSYADMASGALFVDYNGLTNGVLNVGNLTVGAVGSGGRVRIAGLDSLQFHGQGVVNANQVFVSASTSAQGTIDQDGGTFTITNGLVLGQGTRGFYHLNNGTFNAGNVQIGRSDSNAIGSMTIGGSASATMGGLSFVQGVVQQSSGSVSITSGLSISGQFGQSIYQLQGGTLSCGTTSITNNATFSYSGGAGSLGSLTLSQGSQLILSAGGSKVLYANSLSIGTVSGGAFDGGIDLTDNAMVIASASVATVASLIRSGTFDGFTNRSTGIVSSTAIIGAGGAHKTALGYAQAGALGISSFKGKSVNFSSVIIRYTYAGDDNLDGTVNALDFNAVASNFGGSTKTWAQGDFNSDGITNTQDFNALAMNFGQTLAAPSLGGFVPEPFVVSLAALLPLATRQRFTKRFR